MRFKHHVSTCDKFEEYEWYLISTSVVVLPAIYSDTFIAIPATISSSTLPSTVNSSVSQLQRTNLSAVPASHIATSSAVTTPAQCATVPGRGPSAHGPGRQAFEARPALQAREARAIGPRGLRLSQL
jgi:hypothetical protein